VSVEKECVSRADRLKEEDFVQQRGRGSIIETIMISLSNSETGSDSRDNNRE
jgi:hypothetical protein